jgi:formate dehydrogenase subunit delta
MQHDVLDHEPIDHHAMVEAKIIRMANQIALYFESQPETARAAGIAAHINDFWEPRMRTQLLDLIRSKTDRLSASVTAAENLIRKPRQ